MKKTSNNISPTDQSLTNETPELFQIEARELEAIIISQPIEEVRSELAKMGIDETSEDDLFSYGISPEENYLHEEILVLTHDEVKAELIEYNIDPCSISDLHEKYKVSRLEITPSINDTWDSNSREKEETGELPRVLGEDEEGKKIIVSIDRFGPYIRFGDSEYVNIKGENGDDPYKITLDRACEIVAAKKEAVRRKVLKVFEENPTIKVINGRWGAYLTDGTRNVKLSKDIKENPSSLEFSTAIKLLSEAPTRRSHYRSTRNPYGHPRTVYKTTKRKKKITKQQKIVSNGD